MTGCTAAEASPSKPNAHFSLSAGIRSLDSPGIAWNRWFSRDAPQLFHSPARSSVSTAGSTHRVGPPPTSAVTAGVAVDRKAATARRSAEESSSP